MTEAFAPPDGIPDTATGKELAEVLVEFTGCNQSLVLYIHDLLTVDPATDLSFALEQYNTHVATHRERKATLLVRLSLEKEQSAETEEARKDEQQTKEGERKHAENAGATVRPATVGPPSVPTAFKPFGSFTTTSTLPPSAGAPMPFTGFGPAAQKGQKPEENTDIYAQPPAVGPPSVPTMFKPFDSFTSSATLPPSSGPPMPFIGFGPAAQNGQKPEEDMDVPVSPAPIASPSAQDPEEDTDVSAQPPAVGPPSDPEEDTDVSAQPPAVGPPSVPTSFMPFGSFTSSATLPPSSGPPMPFTGFGPAQNGKELEENMDVTVSPAAIGSPSTPFAFGSSATAPAPPSFSAPRPFVGFGSGAVGFGTGATTPTPPPTSSPSKKRQGEDLIKGDDEKRRPGAGRTSSKNHNFDGKAGEPMQVTPSTPPAGRIIRQLPKRFGAAVPEPALPVPAPSVPAPVEYMPAPGCISAARAAMTPAERAKKDKEDFDNPDFLPPPPTPEEQKALLSNPVAQDEVSYPTVPDDEVVYPSIPKESETITKSTGKRKNDSDEEGDTSPGKRLAAEDSGGRFAAMPKFGASAAAPDLTGTAATSVATPGLFGSAVTPAPGLFGSAVAPNAGLFGSAATPGLFGRSIAATPVTPAFGKTNAFGAALPVFGGGGSTAVPFGTSTATPSAFKLAPSANFGFGGSTQSSADLNASAFPNTTIAALKSFTGFRNSTAAPESAPPSPVTIASPSFGKLSQGADSPATPAKSLLGASRVVSPESARKGGFSFAPTTTASTSAHVSSVPATTAAAAPFSFGAPATKASAAPFSFGTPTTKTSAAPFSFGAPTTKASAVPFSFGTPATTASAAPFKFGDTSPALESAKLFSSSPSAPISFGNSATPFTFGKAPGTSAPALPFSFGAPNSGPPTSAAPFSFAVPTPTPAAPSSGVVAEDGEADDEESPADEQLDLSSERPGEEDEDVLVESRGKVYSLEEGQWKATGVGTFRLMKHKATGSLRMIHRLENSAKVVLNAAIQKGSSPTRINPTQFSIAAVNAAVGGKSLASFRIRLKMSEDVDTFVETVEEFHA
ncbi:hypothetical protein HKX48_003241 [Thoreauomyces humboldtii]|nr:hypothetical protein HKX48_003241 [Thoreauomyces humboldtii]